MAVTEFPIISPDNLAWRVTCKGFDSCYIIAAPTSGIAKRRNADKARDAGYRVEFTDFRAVRAREHDAWAKLVAVGESFS